ncbi:MULTISPECIES: amidohydrolase family protein [Prochlorococcus]|uniref:Cytosine deaminase n=1 Tax=Prochlorococcus marinus str. MIT 9116 TaxID=167544 RepID=A0A0A1ZYC0_PROMR|nr:amidohydrolase family protein [Prochlorococcus marinus]KGF91659.1 Cytosine deaminase [Prochlorococcus marinus str. MIT 9107]KGF93153.1 Cytosine deaminase [Prochlorococcus marinus str. MIT 9116]KGF94251.1 Cytosine deaminase [Prochlorococcus marinus str. MIT 9123]
MSNSGKIEALIPRCLCSIENSDNLNIDFEDLCSVSISWENGFVSELKPLKIKNKKPNNILFPRFVEAHSHIDKSFTWEEFPNLRSNYDGALSINLQEHKTRNTKKVLERAEKSLNLAIKNGYRAIRSHIDTYQNQENDVWTDLFKLQRKYSSKLQLQFVALSPLDFWQTKNGKKLAKNFSIQKGILGGVVVPPFDKRETRKLLSKMLLLADKYKLEIDLHIDESITEPGAGVKLLLEVIDKLKIQVPITCSHLSSILFLKENEILNLGKKLADKNIKVVALPLTNFWLLNHKSKITSLKRPVAPIKQLQKSLVDVSIGSDNVQDPWYPFGDFDPLYMMSCSIPMLQLNPWERMTLSSIFLAPSRLLNLKWDGLIKKGCPADFVILDAQKWADIFSSTLKRKVYIKGNLYC